MFIPMFSGDRKAWVEFCDTFNTIIDKNPELSKTQKLLLQKSSVTDEARSLICVGFRMKTLVMTPLLTLSERYENIRLLITSVINMLFAVPNVTLENLTKLRQWETKMRK